MTSQTNHLSLDLLAAEQAQKHITLNEALIKLDALVHLAVISRDLNTPPSGAEEGDRYLVGDIPDGEWTGKSKNIALFSAGIWQFITPKAGFMLRVNDENAILIYNGSAWNDIGSSIAALHNLTRLGVGTSADAGNPFSAKLNNALWTTLPTSEGGTGDLRFVMNKEGAGHTLSMVMQANYIGHAEWGLAGSNHLSLKVSSDGSVWKNALIVDNASAAVGIGDAPSNTDAVQVFGNGAIRLNHATAPQIKFNRTSGSGTTGRIGLDYPTGLNQVLSNPAGAVSAFYEFEPASGSGATISYFRYSTISGGNCYFNVSKGDNTGSTSARLSGGELHSYVNVQGGNFGIGTASVPEKLTVAGNIAPATDNAYSVGVSGRRWSAIWAATGTIQTSDCRLKTDIHDSPLGLDFIKALRPVAYKWIAAENLVERIDIEDGVEQFDTGEVDDNGQPVMGERPTFGKADSICGVRAGVRIHYGLIAQEVKNTLDTFSATNFAGYIEANPNEQDSERGLRYDQFIAPLIKAVQELAAKVQALENA